jgi:hypothetical protein
VTVVDGDLGYRRWSVGRGEVLLFTQDLDAAYTRAVEEGEVAVRRGLETVLQDFLFGRGLRPAARPTNGEFEADVLVGQGCFLLVVVNHNGHDDRTRVEIYNPPVEPGVAYDLATMEEVPFERLGGTLVLAVDLPERCGRVICFYPSRPVANRIELERDVVARGEELAYRVVVVDEAGEPAPGHHAVEITVRDAAGEIRARYGGARATSNGVYSRRSPVAQNEWPGRWTVEVYDRFTHQRNRTSLMVT